MKAKIIGTHLKAESGGEFFQEMTEKSRATARYVPPGKSVTIPAGGMVYFDPLCGNDQSDIFERMTLPIMVGKIGPFFVRPLGDVTIHGPAMVGGQIADELDGIKQKKWIMLRNILAIPYAIVSVAWVMFLINFFQEDFRENPLLMSSILIFIPGLMATLCYIKAREMRTPVMEGDDFPKALRESRGDGEKFVPV